MSLSIYLLFVMFKGFVFCFYAPVVSMEGILHGSTLADTAFRLTNDSGLLVPDLEENITLFTQKYGVFSRDGC